MLGSHDFTIPLRSNGNQALGQVKFVRLFKITVLSLYVLMMKPEIKLIISAVRLYWS